LLEALDIIKKNVETKLRISFQEPRPGDQKIYVSDVSKAKKDFGWEPKTEIGTGIKKLSDWVSENKALFQ